MGIFSRLTRKFKKKRKATYILPTDDIVLPLGSSTDLPSTGSPRSINRSALPSRNSSRPPSRNAHLPPDANSHPIFATDTESLSSNDNDAPSSLREGPDPPKLLKYAMARERTADWVQAYTSHADDCYSPSVPPSEVGDFVPSSPIGSSYSLPPRMVLRYADGRPDIPVPHPQLSAHHRSLLKGAELHSPERDPLPRCHPKTRVDLRGKIHAWLTDEKREQDVLWLLGPAGVGKSAVAQTVGELAEELGTLGAAFFFSRARKIDHASQFITSVCYQLGKQLPSYERLANDVIEKDPFIVTSSDRRAQFNQLLAEPFSDLKDETEHSPKLLIIIDGLDECWGDDEQSVLIQLIVESVKGPDSMPFLWMICSRPEHHLKELLRNECLPDVCLQLQLLPHEVDAQADIQRYLTDGLDHITKRYSNQHDYNLALSVIKDPEKVNKLVHAASGVFVVASSLLGFIGDPIIANPSSQMQIVLNVIDGIAIASGSGNPLAPIDALYVGVLNEVHRNYLPKTLQLLGACAVAPPIPALHLANLIGFTQEIFYSALRTLHAFLSVPHHTTASQESLHFFHASFPDFLFHCDRSQDYYQYPDMHRFELAKAFLSALSSTDIDYSRDLSWLPSEIDQGKDDDASLSESESPLSISHDILSFAATHTWELCTGIAKPREWPLLLKMVASFDFRRLQQFCDVIPVRSFIHFIQWLHKLGREVPELTHIVRGECHSEVDEKLSERCVSIARPLDLESATEVHDLDNPRYVLAGFGMETVVILFVPEAAIVYSLDDVDYL